MFLFLFFFIFSCETKKNKKELVLARVGNETLTLRKLTRENSMQTINSSQVSVLVSSWVKNTILLNEAIKKNIDKDSVLLKKRDVFFKNLVVGGYLDQYLKKDIEVSREDILFLRLRISFRIALKLFVGLFEIAAKLE